MGTRHLIMVVEDGQYKVAQYGQWDGYPTGQGIDICDFIRTFDPLDFKIKVNQLKDDTADAEKARWAEFGIDLEKNDGFVRCDIAKEYGKKYPQFSRDTGAGILNLIAEGKVDTLQRDISFAADSLFCEFAYVLDMDKSVLEVYKGFNKIPVTNVDRFFELQEKEGEKEYYPVVKCAEYSFDEIRAWKTKASVKSQMKKLEYRLNQE